MIREMRARDSVLGMALLVLRRWREIVVMLEAWISGVWWMEVEKGFMCVCICICAYVFGLCITDTLNQEVYGNRKNKKKKTIKK